MDKNVIKIYTSSSDWARTMMFLSSSAFTGAILEIPLAIMNANNDKSISISVKFAKLKDSATSYICIRKMEKDPDTASFTKETTRTITFLADPVKYKDGFEVLIMENAGLIRKALKDLSGEEWEIKF